jgi:hypothetical protein
VSASSCGACVAFDAVERAAIEGVPEQPEHTLDGCTCPVAPTIAMTLLGPERLALTPQRGVSLAVTWPELSRWISSPVVATSKADAGGYVLARLRDGIRRASHVESVSAFAVDHDAGTMTPEAAHEALRRYRHIIHTTASCTGEHPRWRAIVALSRPASPDEYRRIWLRVAGVIERDAPIDHAASDPCRLWYVPTIAHAGAPYVVLAGGGEPLDVDAVLRAIGAMRSTASTSWSAAVSTKSGDYIGAALESEMRAVAGAPAGTRNTTLNRAAYSLARLALSEREIVLGLLAAAKRAGLSEHEAGRTIASGIAARRGSQ